MISIVTLCKDNLEELVKTQHSLEKLIQGDIPFEWVVVDASATQEIKNYLDKKGPLNYPILRTHGRDSGIPEGFNRGIKLATGNFIQFLNSADQIHDSLYYKKALDYFSRDSRHKTFFIHGNILYLDAIAGPMKLSPKNCPMGRGMPFFHQSMIHRKELFDVIGGFDQSYPYAMDFHHICKMIRSKMQYHYIPFFSAIMDGHGTSHRNEKKSILECRRALKETGLYTFSNGFWWNLRILFFYLRSVIILLRGKKLLAFLKMFKNHRDGLI